MLYTLINYLWWQSVINLCGFSKVCKNIHSILAACYFILPDFGSRKCLRMTVCSARMCSSSSQEPRFRGNAAFKTRSHQSVLVSGHARLCENQSAATLQTGVNRMRPCHICRVSSTARHE